jgi:hypothetical protein
LVISQIIYLDLALYQTCSYFSILCTYFEHNIYQIIFKCIKWWILLENITSIYKERIWTVTMNWHGLVSPTPQLKEDSSYFRITRCLQWSKENNTFLSDSGWKNHNIIIEAGLLTVISTHTNEIPIIFFFFFSCDSKTTFIFLLVFSRCVLTFK